MINENNIPLNVDQIFSQILFSISKEKKSFLDLSDSQPFFRLLPPKCIKNILHFLMTPSDFTLLHKLEHRYVTILPHLSNAIDLQPKLKVIKGRPFEFFLNKDENFIIDFSFLGAAIITQKSLNLKIPDYLQAHIMNPILEYIFSDDLWSPNGKWNRFHNEFIQAFSAKNLLLGESSPGRYFLKSEACVLEKYSIKGNRAQNGYEILIPWDFSFSELNQIKKIIEQEF